MEQTVTCKLIVALIAKLLGKFLKELQNHDGKILFVSTTKIGQNATKIFQSKLYFKVNST